MAVGASKRNSSVNPPARPPRPAHSPHLQTSTSTTPTHTADSFTNNLSAETSATPLTPSIREDDNSRSVPDPPSRRPKLASLRSGSVRSTNTNDSVAQKFGLAALRRTQSTLSQRLGRRASTVGVSEPPAGTLRGPDPHSSARPESPQTAPDPPPPPLPPKAPDRTEHSAFDPVQTERSKPVGNFKRFFRSKAAKEREELEADRKRRRRSFVELDITVDQEEDPPPAVAATDTASNSIRSGGGPRSAIARSLRSVGSQASSFAYSEHPSIWQRALQKRPSVDQPPSQEESTQSADTGAPFLFSSGTSTSSLRSGLTSTSKTGALGRHRVASTSDTQSQTQPRRLRSKASASSLASSVRQGQDQTFRENLPDPSSRSQTETSRPDLPCSSTLPRSAKTDQQTGYFDDLRDPHQTPTLHQEATPMFGGNRAASPLPDADAGGSSSKWKLPFGRKSNNKHKKTDDDDWDDYQRGTAPAPDSTRAGNDAKLMSMLGLEDEPARSGRGQRDIMADLRETGYLAPATVRENSRTSASKSKAERWTGAESASSPHMPPASRSSSMSLRHEASGPMGPSAGSSSELGSSMERDCPVCLEPLSYRLAGEKPHVVPNCGHALHNACFTAVYGQPEAIMASQRSGGGPPGMCGVCRKAIVLGGDVESGGKSSKLAGMMGLGVASDNRMQHTQGAQNGTEVVSASHDDPIDSSRRGDAVNSSPSNAGYSPSGMTRVDSGLRQGMVHPIIRVRPEYSTLYRKDPTGQNGRQNIVCVISVEVPSRRPPPTEEEEEAKHRIQWRTLGTVLDESADDSRESASAQTAESGGFDDSASQAPTQQQHNQRSYSPQPLPLADQSHAFHSPQVSRAHHNEDEDEDDAVTADGAFRHATKESESSHREGDAQPRDQESDGDEEGFSFGATPPAAQGGSNDAHAAVLADLRDRIADWKGQTIERFGDLVLYDHLGVRQEAIVRNFWVYLFNDALLCVTEERKKEKGLARLMNASNGSAQSNGGKSTENSLHATSNGQKPGLKLKGRIWLRHISRVEESSSGGNLSLSIQLDDESLDHFILCFSERATLDLWRGKLVAMVQQHKPPQQRTPSKTNGQELPPSNSVPEALSQENGGGAASTSNVARRSTTGSVMSGKSGSTAASGGNGLMGPPSISSAAMGGVSAANGRNVVENLRRASRLYSTGSMGIPTEQQWSASGGLDPSTAPPPMQSHTPLDLILMVSVPVVVQQQHSGISSSAALKLRLIRSTLEFVASRMGPRDRLSIVAYTAGQSGEVRRTALLSASRDKSRQKLTDFVEGIGRPWTGNTEDPYRVDANKLGGGSERTDTVTALNVGLDVVLGRKSKNPCAGMILINDTSDGPVRGQMDLVMARAEAANVPIHCFGFGKSSNPSSLWLVSNHTRGSYTFVKEWYQLRECVAGCIGSLMSTALDQLKLYIAVPSDNHFKVRKVSGPTGAIVSSSGKEVDIELGELRFGEVRELFVELEVDFNGLVPFLAHTNGAGKPSFRRLQNAPAIEQGSATDDFMQRLGLQDLSLNESGQGGGGIFDGDADALNNLIEEVAVFEIDAAYRDPGVGASLARLSNPTVLTVEVDAHTVESGVQGRSADPVVTRRRIEILVSEMITRSLLLVSRKNYTQALRIVNETHKIVETVLRALSTDDSLGLFGSGGGGGGGGGGSSGGGSTSGGFRRSGASTDASHSPGKPGGLRSAPSRQRTMLHRRAIASLLAILDDLELIATGLESGQRSQFERDGRNAAAQQAMVLRDQQAWTTRTATEALRFLADNGPAFAAHAFAASRAS
ncbi:unnamed protein product [Parajaminaea phylloscopi]